MYCRGDKVKIYKRKIGVVVHDLGEDSGMGQPVYVECANGTRQYFSHSNLEFIEANWALSDD